MKFEKVFNKIKAPFAIYADFECVLSKVDQDHGDSNHSHTTAYINKHEPLGVVLPSGLGCQHSLAGRLGDLAGHDGVDDGVVDVRQALN